MKTITTSKACENLGNFLNWESDNISDSEFRKLRTKAKRAFDNYYNHKKQFSMEACWITSGCLHGFYFPNTTDKIRAVLFLNNKTATPILLIDDED